MSLGSQLHEALKEFQAALPQESKLRPIVEDDVTILRRNGVDGVGVLDDTGYEILSRLYGDELPGEHKSAKGSDSLEDVVPE
jgi:hypothetical protein